MGQKNKNYILDIVIIIIFAVIASITTAFHEPWFDEAQAWLIARDSSISQMLTYILHYEGHPPLWHFLLMLPARGGVPFELGLKATSIICSTIAVAILVLKSSFPRWVRYLLPFSYFIIYQYTVVARNYSLMFLAFMLMAVCYENRNSKPYLYVVGLVLLCGSNAYGSLFACGITLVWVGEILQEKISLPFLLKHDKRIRALGLLLVVAILMGLCMLPFPDATGLIKNNSAPWWNKLLWHLFIWPVQLTYSDMALVRDFFVGTMAENIATLILIFVGCLLQLFVLYFAKKTQTCNMFLCPFVLVALFSSQVYFFPHHEGVFWLFLIFYFWISYNKVQREKIEFPVELRKLTLLVLVSSFCMNLYWSGSAIYHDYLYEYSCGRHLAQDLKNLNLADKQIWGTLEAFKDKRKNYAKYALIGPVEVNSYFSHNIITNKDMDRPCSYAIMRAKDADLIFAEMEKLPKPDVVLTLGPMASLNRYSSFIDERNYKLLKTYRARQVYKDSYYKEYQLFLYQKR